MFLTFDFSTSPLPAHVTPSTQGTCWADVNGLWVRFETAGGYVAVFFDEVCAKWFSPAECARSRNGLGRAVGAGVKSLRYGCIPTLFHLPSGDGCDSSGAVHAGKRTHQRKACIHFLFQQVLKKLQDHSTGSCLRLDILRYLRESHTKGKYLPLALILLLQEQILNPFLMWFLSGYITACRDSLALGIRHIPFLFSVREHSRLQLKLYCGNSEYWI